ncbi:unnamed protein product [Musa hybrid cultivar]
MGLVKILLFLLASTSTGSIRTESRSTNTTFLCPKNCGNISFECPFGIGDGCSRPGFNLTCRNHSTSAPRLFLGDGTVEVTRIDMNQGLVYIKPPTVVMGVDDEFKRASLIDLENWPYSFELMEQMTRNSYQRLTSNRVYVVGCSAMAKLVDLTTNKTISTCFSICAAGDPSQYSEWSDINNRYCTMNLWSKNSTALEIQLTRIHQTELHLVNTTSIKVIIFNGDNDDREGVLNGSRTNVEATLAWYMNDHLSCEEAINTDAYACVSQNSVCRDIMTDTFYSGNSSGYLCQCLASYQGNPYVPSGCQDESFTPTAAVAANGCVTKCGSIDVLFPFGLEKGCYRDDSFALTCNTTSNPPTLLFDYYYTVTNISLEEGILELEEKYGSIFMENSRTGTFVFFKGQAIVSWVIELQRCEDAKKNTTTFACGHAHSSCIDTTITNDGGKFVGYRCKCWQGYQGNPYMPNGCTDINECNSTEKRLCYGICTNTDGGYTCTCAPGTYGDPKLAPCIPNNKKQTLLLGKAL